MSFIHTFRSHRGEKGLFRWHMLLGERGWGIQIELSRRWRSSGIATIGYGGQEHFADATIAIPRLFFANIQLETPFKWKRLRPRDGKYGESEAEFGVRVFNGSVRVLLGHDPMGTYYGGGPGPAWRRALRQTWKNRQLSLWENDWLVGRRRAKFVDLAEFPCTLDVGQWEGDSYLGTMKLRRLEWTQRWWRKGQRLDWDFEMPSPGKGIPIPGNTDSDFYDGDDGIFGFGESADHWTLEEAKARLVERVKRDRKGWRPALGGES